MPERIQKADTSMKPVHPESVLLVTLDSCRYDTALSTQTPSFDLVGPMHEAMAPAHFTLASHSAMWVGTTPGIAGLGQPVLDPKAGRLFRLITDSIDAGSGDVFALEGATIIEGFHRRGHTTIGAGAVDWFDPATAAGYRLVQDFEKYRMFRGGDVSGQVAWVCEQITTQPAFVFINVGETHVPYWHKGANWSSEDNPCNPYSNETNREADCRFRQAACLHYADYALNKLIEAFRDATIMITADHGDAWGEDGLWEHGTWHPIIMKVPLWVRVRGDPVQNMREKLT